MRASDERPLFLYRKSVPYHKNQSGPDKRHRLSTRVFASFENPEGMKKSVDLFIGRGFGAVVRNVIESTPGDESTCDHDRVVEFNHRVDAEVSVYLDDFVLFDRTS